MNNNSSQKHAVIIVSLALVVGGSFYFGYRTGYEAKPEIEKVSQLANKEMTISDKIDFEPFWHVWNIINEKYVGKGTTTAPVQERVWGAIEGLADSLGDPFTVFLPPEENKSFEIEISGSFEGVGMEIANKDDWLIVVAPLKDTPAYRAGIQPGDKILKINDTSAVNLKSDQGVKLIRGPKGTEVKLLIERTGRKEPFEVKITRDRIQIPTIDTEVRAVGVADSENDKSGGLRKDGIFVIRLYNFSERSPELFQNALRQFIQTGADKLILDLRGNPGGYLGASIEMASWFLPIGKTIVREDFGGKQTEIVHRSRGYNVFNQDLKMIILVNDGSASASEILAGALQEYGVAKLVGTNTFGKGSVQELIKITSDTSFKVTIAKWLTPNGVSISEGGLKPDYEVKMTEKDREAKKDPQMDKAVELLKKN